MYLSESVQVAGQSITPVAINDILVKFGRCKECREYRMLYGNGKCYTHTSDVELTIGLKTLNGAYMPSKLLEFTSTVDGDIRISNQDDDYDTVLVMAEMEVIVEDSQGDPIQTFEFSEYPQNASVSRATEDALEWVAQNS